MLATVICRLSFLSTLIVRLRAVVLGSRSGGGGPAAVPLAAPMTRQAVFSSFPVLFAVARRQVPECSPPSLAPLPALKPVAAAFCVAKPSPLTDPDLLSEVSRPRLRVALWLRVRTSLVLLGFQKTALLPTSSLARRSGSSLFFSDSCLVESAARRP
ncbi:hypothetical protein IG631_24210 [Alternaria alternata]|nr:hypothetical protein IG631_24210 [Alternaria alternata]